jgi:SAM-dependent methyltransferase
MIGSLLKELAVKSCQYVRYQAARTVFGNNGGRKLGPNPRNEGGVAPSKLAAEPVSGLRLDLGCGKSKRPEFLGIDRRSFEGVDGVTDLTKKRWLFKQSELGSVKLIATTFEGESGYVLPDNSVTEVHCSHFLEHLEHNQAKPERVRFMNELWRILIPGGRATIITPHWASNRAFGDFTHADKPVSEMFYSYLDKEWRKANAPDNDVEFNPDGYTCDFEFQIGHSVHPEIAQKEKKDVDFAVSWYKDAALDLFATLVAKK